MHASSPAKNIINLISVLIIWWCPCVEFCCVVARGCLLWPVHSLGKTLLTFACSVLYSEAKLAHQARYLLTSYFFTPVPMMKRTYFFGVIGGLIGLLRTVQPQSWKANQNDHMDHSPVYVFTNTKKSVFYLPTISCPFFPLTPFQRKHFYLSPPLHSEPIPTLANSQCFGFVVAVSYF